MLTRSRTEFISLYPVAEVIVLVWSRKFGWISKWSELWFLTLFFKFTTDRKKSTLDLYVVIFSFFLFWIGKVRHKKKKFQTTSYRWHCIGLDDLKIACSDSILNLCYLLCCNILFPCCYSDPVLYQTPLLPAAAHYSFKGIVNTEAQLKSCAVLIISIPLTIPSWNATANGLTVLPKTTSVRRTT